MQSGDRMRKPEEWTGVQLSPTQVVVVSFGGANLNAENLPSLGSGTNHRFPKKNIQKYHRKLLNGETPTSCRNSQYVMVKKSWFPPLTFGISGPLRCGFPDDPSRSERQPRDRLPSQQFQPGRRCGQRLRGGSTGGSPVVTSHPWRLDLGVL